MTEISFARSFLSALDARPIKLSSDHTSDPRRFTSGATYTIPKYPSSPAKRKRDDSLSAQDATSSKGNAPSSTSGGGLSVTLANLKSPKHNLKLEGQPPNSSIYDLKTAYASRFNVPSEKIKLLYAKKPIADSKTLADVVTSGESDVEFGVMLLGGVVPSDEPVKEEVKEKATATAPGVVSGKDVLGTEQFWSDLKGFLVQRIRDEKEGERLAGVFREAAGC